LPSGATANFGAASIAGSGGTLLTINASAAGECDRDCDAG
jgi:hypothetical protein